MGKISRYSTVLCPSCRTSNIRSGRVDQLGHVFDDPVVVQHAQLERRVAKVHQVAQVDDHLALFRQPEQPLGAVIPTG